jgi:hypothetical protein
MGFPYKYYFSILRVVELISFKFILFYYENLSFTYFKYIIFILFSNKVKKKLKD